MTRSPRTTSGRIQQHCPFRPSSQTRDRVNEGESRDMTVSLDGKEKPHVREDEA